MKTRPLGRSDLIVSELCLGSMTWAAQNSTAEGHAQIDRALDAGVNFIDTAEMYPGNPVARDRVGLTEKVIGEWMAANKARRGDVILATKASGENGGFVRDGHGFDGTTIEETLDGSLARLQTDYVDLYQLHWPQRGSYHFRQHWHYAPKADRAAIIDHMVGVLEALGRAQKAGKIRHVGLSNETAWGTAQWLRLSDELGLPRMISIQNEYSLLCRGYDTDLAELGVQEDVGLFAYSPIGAGLLSGKYAPDVTPDGSRRSFVPTLGGRVTERVWPAIEAYRVIARKWSLELPQMALAWTLTRPFLGSSIFGATSRDQLDLALGAAELTLSDELLAEIDEAHMAHPMPF